MMKAPSQAVVTHPHEEVAPPYRVEAWADNQKHYETPVTTRALAIQLAHSFYRQGFVGEVYELFGDPRDGGGPRDYAMIGVVAPGTHGKFEAT